MIDHPPLTVAQLCERWACSRKPISRMIADGRLRVFRLGGKVIRIPFAEVIKCEQDFLTADTPSDADVTATSSPGATRAVSAAVIDSARKLRIAPGQP